MNTKILKYLFYLSIFSFVIGPLGAIPLGILQVNIYLTDIIVGLIYLTWITKLKQVIKFIQTDSIAKYFWIFVAISLVSLIFAPLNLAVGERLISGLYIVRLIAYFFVYLTVKMLIKVKLISAVSIEKLLIVVGLILAILGWLQYFLYPDLRNLFYMSWDPHFKRIFSTYLDPNYFGLMMVLTLIVLTFSKRFTWKESLRNTFQVAVWIFIFLTLMFTYSRSSFLALVGAFLYLSLSLKRIKIIMVILFILAISILLLPRPGGVGVQLERSFSIETRIENWQQAIKIFTDHPVLGVGFNTTRYAKREYNFGQDNLSENHAGAGFDNSFVFIAATTGIVGLLSYLLFLSKIFSKGSLLMKASLVAIIVHSFFLNSLFFPWIMVWMWVILGISIKTDNSS